MADILLTVRGDAETQVSPELAVVRVSAVAEGPDRDAVATDLAEHAAPVRSSLERLESTGEVTAWSSASASIWTERPWSEDGRRLDALHHATLEMTATFADTDALSSWVSRTLTTDGIRLSHVEWQLTAATRRRLEEETAAAAVHTAVARAEAYAAALGRRGVEPVEIADAGLLRGAPDTPTQPMFARAALASADGGQGVELRPADIVIAVSVEGRFIAR